MRRESEIRAAVADEFGSAVEYRRPAWSRAEGPSRLIGREMTGLAAALLDALDDEALDVLADRLAPRLAERLGAGESHDGWLRGADEIARYIGAPRSRVYALTSAGRLPAVQRDGSALVARKLDLDEWVRAGGARRP